ncbi:S8 family serine peptidase [Mycoplasmopsis verecunda]|uniref:Subtilase family protein n=1 Tax=Mycoplasmopsis verecunda TaxID=171291 RepID=A0A1T4LZ11_9BACT|nr:S8 family serine peptidase [Mycoplasmopsis verecunda]WPB54469.1 S8 family serine peptidase [Mycoplasmopsis verecunda]SJZ59886.1 Subtilase family protein [Mycoplasmopsis verecunda]
MKNKLKKKFLFTAIGVMPPIALTTPMVAAASNVSTTIKLNKNSNLSMDENLYNELTNMYKAYYHRLGIDEQENITYKSEKSDSDKVGIIEVNDIDENLLMSKNPNFTFNKMQKNYFKKDYHAASVASIIGTDMGINPNANIYFAALNYKDHTKDNLDKLVESIEYMKENNVKIVNLSLGLFSEVLLPLMFSEYEVEDMENNAYEDFVFDLFRAINFIKKINTNESVLEEVFSRFSRIFHKYIIEDDMIFVISAGNDEMLLEDFIGYPKDWYRYFISDYEADMFQKSDIDHFVYDNFGIIWELYTKKGAFLDKVKNAFNKYIDYKDYGNIIFVGSVTYENKASAFSSHGLESETLPLISAYGDSYINDDKNIKDHKRMDVFNKTANFAPNKAFVEYLRDFQGTSMSAPMITGLLSLLQSNKSKSLSNTEASALLVASAGKTWETDNGSKHSNGAKVKIGFGVPNYRTMSYYSDNWYITKFKDKMYAEDIFYNDETIDLSENPKRLWHETDFTNQVVIAFKHFTYEMFIEKLKNKKMDNDVSVALISYFSSKKEKMMRNNIFDLHVQADIEFRYPFYHTYNYFYIYTRDYKKNLVSNSDNSYIEKVEFDLYSDYVYNEDEVLKDVRITIKLPQLKELREFIEKIFNFKSADDRWKIYQNAAELYIQCIKETDPVMIAGGK